MHARDGEFDFDRLAQSVREFGGLKGSDLAREVTCVQPYDWREAAGAGQRDTAPRARSRLRVAALDFGAKTNILRCLADAGTLIKVFPASVPAAEILDWKPHGVFLSNGPGDPAATGGYAVPTIRQLLAVEALPLFGICLGHQMLAIALGGRTVKMSHGHHGANHPVKDVETGRVEITSMNHGFAVDRDSLPDCAVETHVSLFDGSNCGPADAGPPGIFSAVSPGGQSGAKGQPLSVRKIRNRHAELCGCAVLTRLEIGGRHPCASVLFLIDELAC